MQEDVNNLSDLRNRANRDKRLLMNRSLLNPAVATLPEASQYARHIAYNAIINLISVRRGFRANEVPFFRIPTNGTRRSAYFIEEQGDSLKPQVRTAVLLCVSVLLTRIKLGVQRYSRTFLF